MSSAHARLGALAAAGAALATLLALLARGPQTLFFWDEFQLAYGVLHFDLARHQPHPPGYLWFVWLGRALLPLAGDPALALRWAAAGATACFAALACGLGPARLSAGARGLFAAAAACFAVFSPLVGRFGVLGLTYAVEGAVWLAWLLAFAGRPAGPRLLALAGCAGLAGGLRPTLSVWAGVFLLWGAFAPGAWIPRRRLAAVAGAFALGTAVWVGALLAESGGFSAWREASGALAAGNVWSKSIFAAGVSALPGRLAAMLVDLGLGLGLLGPAALGVAILRRRRGAPGLARLDPLLAGAALVFASYALLIYDTAGYLVAAAMPLAAYALRGCAELVAELPAPRQLGAGAAACGAALLLAVSPDGRAPHEHFAVHDALLEARFAAVRRAFAPRETVLVTSQEYRDFGLRHVAHYLPAYPTLQLVRDDFFAIVTPDRPYLVSQDGELRAVGPPRLDLATLLPDGRLRQVVYMLPTSKDGFVTPSCAPLLVGLPAGAGGTLPVLRVRTGWQVLAEGQRLRCRGPDDTGS